MWTFRNFAKKEVLYEDFQVTFKSSGEALFEKIFDGNLGQERVVRWKFC